MTAKNKNEDLRRLKFGKENNEYGGICNASFALFFI